MRYRLFYGQYFFLKKRGGGGSKVVWKFSGNSSIMDKTGFPYIKSSCSSTSLVSTLLDVATLEATFIFWLEEIMPAFGMAGLIDLTRKNKGFPRLLCGWHGLPSIVIEMDFCYESIKRENKYLSCKNSISSLQKNISPSC